MYASDKEEDDETDDDEECMEIGWGWGAKKVERSNFIHTTK
jgi:hypothetical protein